MDGLGSHAVDTMHSTEFWWGIPSIHGGKTRYCRLSEPLSQHEAPVADDLRLDDRGHDRLSNRRRESLMISLDDQARGMVSAKFQSRPRKFE